MSSSYASIRTQSKRRAPKVIIKKGGMRARGAGFPLWRLIILCALMILFPNLNAGANAGLIAACLTVFYLLWARAAVLGVSMRPGLFTVLSIDTVFYAFSFLVFFYPYQSYLFGTGDLTRTNFFGYTFADWSNEAIVLSLAGVLAFSIGFDKWRARGQVRLIDHGSANASRIELSSAMYVVPVLMCCLVVVYLLAGWSTSGQGRYSGVTSGGQLAETIYTIVQMLSLVTVALLIYCKFQRVTVPIMLWLGVATALYWSVRTLLGGDRNGFFLTLIVLVAGVATFVHRIGLIWLVLIFAASILLYQLVEISRSAPGLSLVDAWAALGQDSADGRDSSFNITTISVRAGLAAVPSDFEYGFGRYTLIGVSSAIPFLSGIVGAGSEYVSSANILSRAILGPNPTWGVGTNVISDAYIDFGVLGVPISLWVLGLIASAIEVKARTRPGMLNVVGYLLAVALFAELPRYSLTFPVRIMVWAMVLLFFLRWWERQLIRHGSHAISSGIPNG